MLPANEVEFSGHLVTPPPMQYMPAGQSRHMFDEHITGDIPIKTKATRVLLGRVVVAMQHVQIMSSLCANI
jgi:hypothetical protein